MPRPAPRRFALLAAATLAAACSLSGEIADHAIAYNQTIADVENEMLLLNIVRSAKWYPRHYSRLANLDGSLKTEASIQGTAPIGPRQSGSDSLVGKLLGSSNPTFSMQILNTQKFYNGILKPVDVATLELFLGQGWPISVLANLLVEQADIFIAAAPGAPQVWCKVASSGNKYDHYAKFNIVAGLMDKFSREAAKASKVADFGPPLPLSSVRDIAAMATLRNEGFNVVDRKGRLQLQRKSTETLFKVSGAVDAAAAARLDAAFKSAEKTPPPWCNKDDMKAVIAQTAAYDQNDGDPARQRPLTIRIHMRSADAMVHHAGELVRAQEPGEDSFEPRLCDKWVVNTEADEAHAYGCAPSGEDPFLIRVARDLGDGAVTVAHEGTVYAIPKGPEGGRSMQVLALIQQVFSLNISSDETPKNQNIRLISQ